MSLPVLQVPPPTFYACPILLGILTLFSSQQQFALTVFDRRMEFLKKMHAKVLATWACINVGGSGVLAFTTEACFFYFHLMNTSWGLVNIMIAAFLYYHHNQVFRQPQSLLQQIKHQRHAEKMIAFNIGLDMTFIATGIAFYQRGQILHITYPELWIGFGSSIVIQGVFLLLQDITFYRLHVKNRQQVYPLWQQALEML